MACVCGIIVLFFFLLPGEVPRRRKDAPSIFLPHQSQYVPHIALDIGGSLIKLVYFSFDTISSGGGKLHFVKFETSKVDECIDFIESKGLHRRGDTSIPARVKATGGGAFKFSEKFRDRLGLILEREDEMACMVGGCNFLLKAVRHEAFTYENGQMGFVDISPETAYPYLLVNIGSGVSIVRVDGEGRHQRVSGTNIGGGTFWGLCRLLTRLTSFDEILKLSSEGDNSQVDMLVGDIYGGRDYSSIGLSANTIASSFGKVIYDDRELSDYNPADIAMSLCRMISYNIGQLAYLNAKRYNLSRIFFGGFFIRGHPYTMETISFAIRFWSGGEMVAHFLRHEGFLGAVGAFMRLQPLGDVGGGEAGKVRARFVERFSIGAPVTGGEVHGPAMHGIADKTSWVEKFVAAGKPASKAAKEEHEAAKARSSAFLEATARAPQAILMETEPAAAERGEAVDRPRISTAPSASTLHVATPLHLHVGVLHFTPTLEPFPLLIDPAKYNPNTIDINADAAEMAYWIGILQDAIPTVVEKAAASEGCTAEAVRRSAAFGRAFDLHLSRVRSEPGAYGQLGLADLFELREECLREFGFSDVYRLDKDRENAAALEVLPDLLQEIDLMPPPARLLALIQGVLAANIFDWGARACVDLYQNATILEMYREARTKLSSRPWRVDDLGEFADVWFGKSLLDDAGWGRVRSPYRRIIVFVDNAGADVVLGMLPLVREFLAAGAEVVLVANSLPAINDITADELRSVVSKVSDFCPVIKAARDAGVAAQAASGGRIPPFPGLCLRPMSSDRLSELGCVSENHELNKKGYVEGGYLEGLHVAKRSSPLIDLLEIEARGGSSSKGLASDHFAHGKPFLGTESSNSGRFEYQLCRKERRPSQLSPKGMFGESYPSPWREPRLYIVASGQGSPCLDLRRVSIDVADATVGADLVIIEGMGRAIHTNFRAKMKCDVLKLAMIKNRHLARNLFGGDVYDCVCRFDEAQTDYTS